MMLRVYFLVLIAFVAESRASLLDSSVVTFWLSIVLRQGINLLL